MSNIREITQHEQKLLMYIRDEILTVMPPVIKTEKKTGMKLKMKDSYLIQELTDKHLDFILDWHRAELERVIETGIFINPALTPVQLVEELRNEQKRRAGL